MQGFLNGWTATVSGTVSSAASRKTTRHYAQKPLRLRHNARSHAELKNEKSDPSNVTRIAQSHIFFTNNLPDFDEFRLSLCQITSYKNPQKEKGKAWDTYE